MSLYPQERARPADRLVVDMETSPGSGQFEVDERLRPAEVLLGSDLSLSRAVIEVRTDGGFGPAEAREAYHPALRLAVRTDESDAWRRTILFDGFVGAIEAGWAAAPEAAESACRLIAEHVAGRLASETMVLGRHVRSLAIERRLAADPLAWQGRSEWVSALPCVFNFHGMANCSAEPLVVNGPGGAPIRVHVFCGEGDPAAVPWTIARAIRYLAWFHRQRGGRMDGAELFAATASFVDLPANEHAQVLRQDSVGRALVGAVPGVCCEAMNVVEALAVLVEAAGLHLTAETASEAGRPVSRWRLWAADSGRSKTLRLRGGGAGTSARTVLADNNVSAAALRWDERRAAKRVTVIGGIKHVEVTVPLWPGWLPEANVDNVPAEQRAAAKALAWTPEDVFARPEQAAASEWFQRYHKSGSRFASFAAVGRRWVLNEGGRYGAEAYNRHAPFDDYRAFDFTTVVRGDDFRPASWMRRPRRFLAPVSAPPEGKALGVWVEVSFDSGTSWHGLSGGIRVLDDPCGVCFDAANPTEVTPPGTDPREQNMWFALIDQIFRVRVTALIETDERLVADPAPAATWRGAAGQRSEIVYEPEGFGFVSPAGGGSVLAEVLGGEVSGGRDDGEAIRALADRKARASEAPGQSSLHIPWIDLEYEIGDRILGVDGAGLSFEAGGGVERAAPSVVGKRYQLANGRYETELILGAGREG